MNKEELHKKINALPIESSDNYPHNEMVDKEEVLELIEQLDESEQEEKKESPDTLMVRAFQNLGTSIKNSEDRRQAELELNRLGYVVVEKPVIPQFVANYLDFAKSDVPLMRVMELANTRKEWPKWEKEYDWISTNDEKFARAWLDGYTVEEKKYRVQLPDKESNATARLLALIKTEDNRVVINKVKHKTFLESERCKLTEEEIKRNHEYLWAFAKPVEE